MSYIDGLDPLHRINKGEGFISALEIDGTKKQIYVDSQQVEFARKVLFTYEGNKRIHRYEAFISGDNEALVNPIFDYIESKNELSLASGKIMRVDDKIVHYIDGRMQTGEKSALDLFEALKDLNIHEGSFKYFTEPLNDECEHLFGYINENDHRILFRGANMPVDISIDIELTLQKKGFEVSESKLGKLLRNRWSGQAIGLTYARTIDDPCDFVAELMNNRGTSLYIHQPNGGIGDTLLSAQIGQEMVQCRGELSVEKGNSMGEAFKSLDDLKKVLQYNGIAGTLEPNTLHMLIDNGTSRKGQTSIDQLISEVFLEHNAPSGEKPTLKYFWENESSFFGYMHTGSVQTLFESNCMNEEKFKKLTKKLTPYGVTFKEFGFARVLKQLFTE